MRRFAGVADRAPAGDAPAATRRLRACCRSRLSAAAPRRAGADGARAVRGAREAPGHRATPGRSSSSRARATPLRFAPGPVHDDLGVRRRARCRSRSAATPAGPARSCTPCAPSASRRRRSARRRVGERAWRSRAVRPRRGRSSELEGRDVVVVAGGIGLAPLRPAILALLARPRALRAARAALRRRARPASCSTPKSSSAGARPASRWRVTVDSAGPEWLGHVGVVAAARCAAPASTPPSARRAAVRAGGDDALHRRRARGRGVGGERVYVVDGAQHAVRHRPLRPLPARADARLPRRAGLPLERARAAGSRSGSCDGRAAEAHARGLEVLLVRRLPAEPARLRGRAAAARRARSRSRYFLGGDAARSSTARTTSRSSRARSRPRTTPSASSEVRAQLARADHDRRVRDRRRDPGAAQLRRRRATSRAIVYASPDYISHARDVHADQRARARSTSSCNGCPINKAQLLEVIGAHLAGRRPRIRAHSVCVECKRRGTVCVMVAHGTACLGPVTHAGCGAICPAYDRGCYGCYGPMEAPNTACAERAHGRARACDELDMRARVPHVQRRRRRRSRRRARRHERG